jgi:protein-S-isoprenylcysteine O-methyltransferase Ste14
MIFQLKVLIFIVTSIPLAWLSLSSLRDARSHGFYRFFAWEAILAVIVLNIDYWFHKPFGIYQIFSWLLLTASALLVIHGIYSLRVVGKPNKKRDDPMLIGIEKTTELVTERAYRYIRHPIYSAGLFLVWGAFFKRMAWSTFSLGVISTLFLTMTAKKEEVENLRFFGDPYQSYMKKTKMFIPFLF